MNDLLELLAAFCAAVSIMILHEFPKAVVYQFRNPRKVPLKKLFLVTNYIDPVGLMFCTITNAGFSKPYRFKFESKKKALLLGVTGYVSLIVCFLVGLLTYRILFTGIDIEMVLASNSYSLKFTYWFVCFFILNSIGMFVVNLFPIASFDMGLCVAGVSLLGFIAMIRKDTVMKILLFFVLYLESIPNTAIHLVNKLFQIMAS